jgi:hypothetical protein
MELQCKNQDAGPVKSIAALIAERLLSVAHPIQTRLEL